MARKQCGFKISKLSVTKNDFLKVLEFRSIIWILLGITVPSHPNASFTSYIFAITIISTTEPTHPLARQLLYTRLKQKIICLLCNDNDVSALRQGQGRRRPAKMFTLVAHASVLDNSVMFIYMYYIIFCPKCWQYNVYYRYVLKIQIYLALAQATSFKSQKVHRRCCSCVCIDDVIGWFSQSRCQQRLFLN